MGDDAQDVLGVVAELASDAEQAHPVFGAEDDAVAVQFLSQNPELGQEESDASIVAGAETLEQQVQQDE